MGSRAASGAPYEQAVAKFARAVTLVHCSFRPFDALPLARDAQRLLSEHCPGTDLERGWLALLLDYALECTGNYSELVESVLKRERESLDREDDYSKRQLLLSVPLALLVQDRAEAALAFLRQHWVRVEGQFAMTDVIGLLRTSTVLCYQGEVAEAYEVLVREWAWMDGLRPLRGRVVRENAAYHRIRSAVALYWQTHDPRLKREVQWMTAHVEWMRPVKRAFLRVLVASLARADGDDARCRSLLQASAQDFRSVQSEPGQWSVRYRLAQLNRIDDAVAEAGAWMVERGVRNPEKWISLTIPGAPGFG